MLFNGKKALFNEKKGTKIQIKKKERAEMQLALFLIDSFFFLCLSNLLEGNKLGRVSSTNTGTTVLDRLVRDGELSEVVTSHLRLDFNLVEDLTVVDTNDGTNHLRNDDHVTEMGLDDLRLLTRGSVLLGSTELLDETHRLTLKTTLESSTSTTVNELHELYNHWSV